MAAEKPNIGILSNSAISFREALPGYIKESGDPVITKLDSLASGLHGISRYLIEAHEVNKEEQIENKEKDVYYVVQNIHQELKQLTDTINNNTKETIDCILQLNDKLNYLSAEISLIKEQCEIK